MTHHKPKLFDLPASKTKYEAGDRVVLFGPFAISEDQRNRVIKSTQKHCGAEIRCLYVDSSKNGILLKRWDGSSYGESEVVVAKETITQGTVMGVATMKCGKLQMASHDMLIVYGHVTRKDVEEIEEWAGKDVGVLFESIRP